MARDMQKTVEITDGDRPGQGRVAAFSEDREQLVWSSAMEALDGLPNGGFNIAHEAVDRHAWR